MAVYMATKHIQKKIPYDYIIPIQVASLGEEELYNINDSQHNHISERNYIYSELTALYSLWKNTKDDFIGLCHYRRFFNITIEDIKKQINEGVVIIPQKAYLGRSLKNQFIYNHPVEIWEKMMSVLEIKDSLIYEKAVEIFQNNIMYPFNMVIGNKKFIDEYCSWLFPILFEIENEVGTNLLNQYQQRYAGFLSERLFTLYVFYHKIEVEEVILINEKSRKISPSIVRNIRNKLFFYFFGRKNSE